ncbi:MAG TPA: cytochrome C [Gammaproteobacteria bacterium]|nr:cytochrome C [Gammaproteobacteria bacterium]
MDFRARLLPVLGSALLLALASFAQSAWAVPSYSRQTGLSCNACHTVPPQLKPFGRYFKLHGYVMSANSFKPSTPQHTPKENIGPFAPMSAMILMSDTFTRKAQTGTQNGAVAFPDQLSLFYAGQISSNMGAFLQYTYDAQSDHFTMDNTDIRYANDASIGKTSVVWGVSLNNNPTVTDPWNSTPAWGYPFLGSPNAPGPDYGPQIMDLGGQVAGLNAYAWFNNSIYAELGLYRSAQIGGPQPLDSSASNVINGAAPYWRLAWQNDWSTPSNYTNSFEVGTFGYAQHVYPGGGAPLAGATDDYTDYALDSQYQLLAPSNSSLTARAMLVHESQSLHATDPGHPDNHLNTLQVNAQYYWHERYGPTVGYFQTKGNSNPALYSSSRTFSPDSSGFIAQWTWLPDYNVQLMAQYIHYNKFDGASSNYDGSGRSASDNDTLYLTAWILW